MKRTDFGKNANARSIIRKLNNQYGSKMEAFSKIFENFSIPKCSCCNNFLDDVGTIEFDNEDNIIWKKPRLIACLRDNCYSSTILKNSSEYRIKVFGRSEEFVKTSNHVRCSKSSKTKKENGYFDDISNNPFSKEYWIKRGLSEEEALFYMQNKAKKMIITKQQKGYFDDISNNPFSKEYWIKRGLSEEEAQNIIYEKNHNCPEYWVKRGYHLEEALLLSTQSAKTNSLEEIEKRHGRSNALLIYNERRQKLSNKWTEVCTRHQKFGTSKEAINFFEDLSNIITDIGFTNNDVIFKNSTNSNEWFFRNNDKILFYDFAIPSIKFIIEYNGEHVHPNKQTLNNIQWEQWKHAYSKKNADEIFEQDNQKYEIAKQKGWHIIIVWSKETKKDKTLVLSNIKSIIKSIKENQCKT